MTESISLKLWGFFLLLATVMLFAVSPDSYTHDLWCHGDSAWFFMCGESWMRGLVPYDDFTDSKGPLLWLVYGLGYLISHHDYTGVFWISCLVYAVTYASLYRIALTYLHSRRWALMVAVAMSPVLFFPWVHYEVRCEDYNMMLVVVALAEVTALLERQGDHWRRTALTVGACAAATLLIKYNITPLFVVLAAYVAAEAWRRQAGVVRVVALMAAGAALVVTPFVVWMLIVGNFDDFVREYFVNTFTVVSDSQTSLGGSLRHLLRYWRSLAPVIGAAALGGVAMLMLPLRHRLLPLVVVATVVALSMVHATWTFHYGMCLALPVYALIALCRQLQGRPRWQAALTSKMATSAGLIAVLVLTVGINVYRNGEALFYKRDPRSADMQWFTALMSQVERPKVMYYFTGPSPEHGIQVDAVPACRYWASQSGATPLMDDEQRTVARNGGADFIFALADTEACDKLEAMGYTRYRSTPVPGVELHLDMFTRHQLTPVERHQPAPLDILLRRY